MRAGCQRHEGRSLLQRALSVAVLVAAAYTVVSPASPAEAWRNGDASTGGFGTHDWILWQASRLAAENGAGWLDLSAALPATDDPDTVLRDSVNHSYDVWGRRYGTAPTRIAYCYRRAFDYLSTGDTSAASRMLGLLSHYYADICEPFHTDQRVGEARRQARFESAMLQRTVAADQNQTWITYDGYQPASSIKTKAVSAATLAHRDYNPLFTAMKSGGLSPAALAIGRRSLDRAVNGIADLLLRLGSASLVNVTTYGAVGDGVHNDTAAIKAALADAAKSETGVYVPPGTFKVDTLRIPDNVAVQGDGWGSSWLKGGILWGSGQWITDLKLGDYGQTNKPGARSSYTTFERCRFRGGPDGVPLGLMDESCDHLTFKDCLIERNLGTENASHTLGLNNISLNEQGQPGGAHFEYIRFEGCEVGVSNGANGRDVGSPRAGLEATVRSDDGTITHGYHNIELIDCIFEASDEFCVDFDSRPLSGSSHQAARDITIEGCTLKGGGYSGPRYWPTTLCLEDPENVVIRNNVIYRGSNLALATSVGPYAHTLIEGNTFDLTFNNGITPESDPSGSFIKLRGSNERFVDNVVRAVSLRQILTLSDSTDTLVSNNRIYDYKETDNAAMVHLSNAVGNTFVGNYLWTAAPGEPRIEVEGSSSDNTWKDNVLVHE
jgi:hypothetical protein